MKFAAFPLAKTKGMVLGHSVHLSGKVFKKGRTLSQADIAELKKAGHHTVYAAQLDDSDVPEDEAAKALAHALRGPGVKCDTAFTGRANLFAASSGIFQLDETLIHEINAIDEALTIATLRSFERVRHRQMLATIKIIPFAISKEVLDTALKMIHEHKTPLSVSPFNLKRADLILTLLPAMNNKLVAKAEKAITTRLQEIGIEGISVRKCAHNEEAIADCLNETSSKSELTLIMGASATVDRNDVVPSSICKANGTIIHFGMPVDPGNLLLLAEHGHRPVVCLPGCARSPKLNGADWVLERLAAGVHVGPEEIQAMGIGGLLKEIPSRPQPRARKNTDTSTPRVAAIILAAGQSRRMGDINKLTATVNGKPMIAHVADAALSSEADEIILVTGHQEEKLLTALAGRPLTPVFNPDYAKGLSSSVRAGIRAAANISPPIDAAIILLGDMPYVDANLINQLIAAHNREADHFICVPTVHGKRGNPVLWDAAFFTELQQLEGDVGAKHLIAENADIVCEVPVSNTAPLSDIDTPDMLPTEPKT